MENAIAVGVLLAVVGVALAGLHFSHVSITGFSSAQQDVGILLSDFVDITLTGGEPSVEDIKFTAILLPLDIVDPTFF